MKRQMFILLLVGFCYLSGSTQSFSKFETQFTKYKVSTKNCTKIKHFTGSLVFVPTDAFVFSSDDSPDSVDIFFREIHSSIEMIVNEIPMHIDLAGRKYNLVSNGMFEIWAKWEDDTLALHDDKTIEVRLAIAPGKLNPAMEGFKFDKASGSWESYNQLNSNTINSEDADLWGSSAISNDIFAEENERFLTKEDSIRKIVFQAMAIYEFGLFNYDMVIAGETFVKVNATFTHKNSHLQSSVYVVYDNLNSVFNYPANQWETEFALIRGRNYKLFTISEKGQVFSLVKIPDLDEIGEAKYEFELISDESIPMNLEELSTLTGIR